MAEQQENVQGQAPQITDEQRRELEAQWVRDSLQKANSYLAKKGIMPQGVRQADSRILPPLMAVWRIKARENNRVSDYWVISGNLPTDHVPLSVAPNAREAVRHFSFNWQLQAENIAKGPGRADPVQMNFARLLVNRAEGLYGIFNDPALWQNEPA